MLAWLGRGCRVDVRVVNFAAPKELLFRFAESTSLLAMSIPISTTVRTGEMAAEIRRSKEEPEFHNHDVAIALHHEMTRTEGSHYVFSQREDSTISHW